MEAFFENILLELCIKSSILPLGNKCMQWNGACSEAGYGRKRVTWPDGKKTVEKTHRLVYMAHNKILHPHLQNKNEYGEQLDVSHLCNNKKCILIEHLVHEPHCININRHDCFQKGNCSNLHYPYCMV